MNNMAFEWVIGVYNGERGKSVLDHAHAGLGYFIRRTEGSGRGLSVEAAFRRPIDGPRPENLEVANPMASIKLDQLFASRHHFDDRVSDVIPASAKTIDNVRSLLEKRRKAANETVSASK